MRTVSTDLSGETILMLTSQHRSVWSELTSTDQSYQSVSPVRTSQLRSVMCQVVSIDQSDQNKRLRNNNTDLSPKRAPEKSTFGVKKPKAGPG